MQKIILLCKQEFSFRWYHFMPLISFVFLVMGFELYNHQANITMVDWFDYGMHLFYKIYINFPNPLLFPELFCKKILGMFILFVGAFSTRLKMVRMVYSIILFILFISVFLMRWDLDKISIVNNSQLVIGLFLFNFLLQLFAVVIEDFDNRKKA